MTYYDVQQQASQQFPQQWGQPFGQQSPAGGQHLGNMGQPASGQLPGLAAFGQQYGQYGGQQFGQPTTTGLWGQAATTAWGQQQRQLSPQEVGDVVRQLVPLLPQILAQAQQQPQAAFGYGYGQPQRMLTQQDVNEVVRQILPMVPQIVTLLQGQMPQQAAAIYGGWGSQGATGQFGQTASGQSPFPQHQLTQNPFAQNPFAQTQMQQPFGQQGLPPIQAAFGGQMGWGQQSRQLTQQDVGEVVRQLVSIIPQVIGNLQAFTQQRTM